MQPKKIFLFCVVDLSVNMLGLFFLKIRKGEMVARTFQNNSKTQTIDLMKY